MAAFTLNESHQARASFAANGEFLRKLQTSQTRKLLFFLSFPLHNVLFVQYVFLPTEQTETYFKICILTYDL